MAAAAADLAQQLVSILPGADELVLPPLQLVQRGMEPTKAAQLVAHMCGNSNGKPKIQNWPRWELTFAANWQLADGYLRAYWQLCDATSERPLKGGESLAALLSTKRSMYKLLPVAALQPKLEVLQQTPASLSQAEVGQLIAGGLACGGKMETFVGAIAWLVRYGGSVDAAISMLRQAPSLAGYSAATLDSKVAALEAAWDGVLQRQQVAQLVRRKALVLRCYAERYASTTAVLRGWFPQPGDLWAVLDKAPALLAALAAALQASERYLTGPLLRLSRQEFLALVKAAPQAFTMDFSNDLTQHKLAFLTQVGGWVGGCAYSVGVRMQCCSACLIWSAVACGRSARPLDRTMLPARRWAACRWRARCRPAPSPTSTTASRRWLAATSCCSTMACRWGGTRRMAASCRHMRVGACPGCSRTCGGAPTRAGCRPTTARRWPSSAPGSTAGLKPRAGGGGPSRRPSSGSSSRELVVACADGNMCRSMNTQSRGKRGGDGAPGRASELMGVEFCTKDGNWY